MGATSAGASFSFADRQRLSLDYQKLNIDFPPLFYSIRELSAGLNCCVFDRRSAADAGSWRPAYPTDACESHAYVHVRGASKDPHFVQFVQILLAADILPSSTL